MTEWILNTKMGQKLLSKALTKVVSKKFNEPVSIDVSKFDIYTKPISDVQNSPEMVTVNVSGEIRLTERALQSIMDQII